jgi:hypothetical protein
MQVEVLGVYPVDETEEPCHLIELRIRDHHGPFDAGWFYQPPRLKNQNEQTVWLEHLLNADGTSGAETSGEFEIDGEARIAFFMHYLEKNWRLAYPNGIVQLPKPVPMPERLKFIEYSEP